MLSGGCVITLTHHSLNAQELWKAVEDNKAMTVVIVGDAFAKPMLAALEEQPGRYDTSSIVNIVSSGVMWIEEVKQACCDTSRRRSWSTASARRKPSASAPR